MTSGSAPSQVGSSMAREESTPVPVAFCILASVSSKGRIKMEPPSRKHVSSVPLHFMSKTRFLPNIDCLWYRQIHWSQLSAGRLMQLERIWDAGKCSCCWRDYLACHLNTSLILVRFAQNEIHLCKLFLWFFRILLRRKHAIVYLHKTAIIIF